MIRIRALLLVLAAAIPLAGAPARAADPATELTFAKATEVVRRFSTIKQWEGVRNILGAARAVYIAPDIQSGSFLVGYEGGSGLLLRRHGEDWSDPAFLTVSRLSVGLQAGMRESDLLLMIMTDQAIADFISGVSKVSGSGGFALGDLGVSASAAGGVSGGLEILLVSTSRGLALGTGVERMTMSEEKELNGKLYGADAKIESILTKPGALPGNAEGLRKLLREAVGESRKTQ